MFTFIRMTGLAIATVLMLSGCEDEGIAPLRVGLSHWPPNEMAYLAREMGLFDGHNIELIEFASPTEYLPGYVSGGLDASVVSLGSALELVSIDPTHRIVMLLDYSFGADALVARSGINTAQDLQGMRIGYEATALGSYLLKRFLDVSGVSLDAVIPVPVDVVQQEQAFLGGRIDAVVTYEPSVSRLVDAGGQVIVDSTATPEEAMDVLVVHGQVLDHKRPQLEAFAEGWFSALQLHQQDINAAARRAEERRHVSARNYLSAFEKVKMVDRAGNARLFSEERPRLIHMLDLHREFLQRAGLVSYGISSEIVLYPLLAFETQ